MNIKIPLFAVALLVSACGGGQESSRAPGSQIANPASTHCVEKGGQLEMWREEAGVFGVCAFADGTRCEEWRFFRGECSPGDCAAEDGRCESADPE